MLTLSASFSGPQSSAAAERRSLICYQLAQLMGVFIALLGLLIMLAWLTQAHLLSGFDPSYLQMKFHTALSFFLSGIALFFAAASPYHSQPKRISMVCSFLVLALSCIALVNSAAFPGRMAQQTAISFILLSLANLSLAGPRLNRFRTIAATVSFFSAYLSICVYAYDLKSFNRLGIYSASSLYTGIGLALLSIGVFISRPEHGLMRLINRESAAGQLLRRLFPATLLIPFLLGWARLLGLQAGLYTPEFGVAMLTISSTLFFAIIIWHNAEQIERSALENSRLSFLREQVEKLSLKEAERVAGIMENIMDAVITIDRQGRIQSANKAVATIFGYSPKELLGQPFHFLLPWPNDTPPQVGSEALETVDSFVGQTREIGARRKNGEIFPVDISVSEFRSMDEQYFTAIVRDITDRKNAEAKALAEAANETKSTFLANMSHEIRTPLGAVLGFSELLVNPALSPERKHEYVTLIKRNGEYLSNIISDILDISKVESGKLEIERMETPLSEIIYDVSQILELHAKAKGISLSFHSDVPLPRTLLTDSLRLRQILLNIIGNAIKFTNKGYVSIKMLSEPKGESLELRFEVKDSGIGISEEQKKRLFQAFSQADASTKRQFGGTGLGLALSKRLAQLLGGDVVLAESKIGEGSTFIISIDAGPIESRNLEQLALLKDRPPIAPLYVPSENSLKGMKILLVEDAPDNRTLIDLYLSLAGAQTASAENGKEALKLVEQENFDVILMDLQMPIMDGYEAVHELRSHGYRKPVIALTAHAMKEEQQKCVAAGFDAHLSKPVDQKLLIERVAWFGHRETELRVVD